MNQDLTHAKGALPLNYTQAHVALLFLKSAPDDFDQFPH
jgi:hypothetical protein